MVYAVLDACFSLNKQASAGMSAQYLRWELQRHGQVEGSVPEADILLVSCQSTLASDFLRKLRKLYPKKVIIAGGPASTSPYALGLYADMVCVGDGQLFLQTLFVDGLQKASQLPNVWINDDTKQVEIDMNFPWRMPPIQADDNAYRVWCGRGCKKKCYFCQTGWAYKYQENPNPRYLLQQIRQLKTKGYKFGYLSNDVMQHSFYADLPHTEHGSYSVDFLRKHGLPPARQIRLGVEGVSARLRTAVNKPISADDLVDCTAWLNANGKSVRWFMIAGLPDETADDWQELKEAVNRWKLKTQKGVLALSFTAFCPDPATPLATQPLSDGYYQNFLDFKAWFFDGIGWSNRVKIMQPQAPESRLQKAMYSMGLPETALRQGGQWGPNDRVNYPYKNLAKQVAFKFKGGV